MSIHPTVVGKISLKTTSVKVMVVLEENLWDRSVSSSGRQSIHFFNLIQQLLDGGIDISVFRP